VLVEHSHRLVASLVGLLTVALAATLAWQHRRQAGRTGALGVISLAALPLALAAPALLAWALASRPPLVGQQVAAWATAALVLAGGAWMARRHHALVGAAVAAVALVVAQGMLGGTTVVYRLPML